MTEPHDRSPGERSAAPAAEPPSPSGHGCRPLILIIEDEPPVRRFLRVTLSAHDYRVLEAGGGEEGLLLAAQHLPDLLLLDLGLPDLDGLEVMRRLREWSELPIVVLSAREQEAQKVLALDAGADDYLTKPFGLAELLARIRVALRHAARRDAPEQPVFRRGPLRVDLATRRVFHGETEIHLTPTEYRLLTTLIRYAGRVVTHRQLLAAVWGPQAGSQTHYLRVYMTHLRHKLDPDPCRPQLFATEAGVGYRLLGED